MSTNDPLDIAPDSGAAGAVHRRLVRALADLGIAPQPIGPQVQNWANLVDGVITFGALSVTTAARLANLLEDIAAQQCDVPVARGQGDEFRDQPDATASTSADFAPTFEPVAPPFDPVSGPSRLHPRVNF